MADFDDLDLDVDESLSSADLSDFGEVDDSVDYPHIKVATKAFKEVLKVAKLISATGGRDIISKSVCLIPDKDNGKLICRATDFDSYVEKTVELLNVDNVLTESVQVTTDILIKLSKATPVNTIIYKKDDTFYIRLYGGDMVLETNSFADNKFEFSDKVDKKSTFTSIDFYSMIKDLSTVVSSAVNPVERRIVCQPNFSYASYMWALVQVVKDFGNFDLKIKDINILRSLLLNKSEEPVSFYKTEDSNPVQRGVIEGDDFKYAFLLSDTTPTALIDKVKSVSTDSGVFVDFIQFYKMVELAAELPYATGRISLNYNDEGIEVVLFTKKGNNTFTISGSIEGTPSPLAKPFEVQAKLLRVVLRTFATKSSIKLSIDKEGLGIGADDYQAFLFKEV